MHHFQTVSDIIKSTMALPVWMRSWMGSEGTYKSTEKSEASLVVEALMSELDLQVKDSVQREKEMEKSKNKREKGVDYSWLISAPVKHYRVSTMEKLELEELCSKVKPIESGNIIAKFREVLSREPCAQEIPNIFRSCVTQVLDSRPNDRLSMAERVTRRTASLTSLRLRVSPKVLPISYDVELQHVAECTGRTKSMPEFSRDLDVLTV